VGEALPYPDACFDAVLLTTTLCYLDDPLRAFREAYRVLRPGGAFVVAFIDRDGPLGACYAQKRAPSAFYRDAQFHAADEVTAWMTRAGFTDLDARQTLFGDPEAMDTPDPVQPGTGEGGFVVLRGLRPA
jgi:ubiquinone/menaquinone biosynthesis C-methylase UbiE